MLKTFTKDDACNKVMINFFFFCSVNSRWKCLSLAAQGVKAAGTDETGVISKGILLYLERFKKLKTFQFP